MLWFSRVLGIEIRERLSTPEGDYIWLDAGGGNIIELMPHKLIPDSPIGFHHLAFKTENTEEALEEIRATGGTVRGDAFDGGFGLTIGEFDGPEGILFRLIQREDL